MKRKFILFFIPLLLSFSAHAAPPIISYGGQVSVDGQPFTGTGLFKFAFVDGQGKFSYWSHDGTSTSGSQPTGQVSLSVNAGLYSVLLGDTGITGMSAIDESVFQNHNDVHLRIWFSDGQGFEQLTPDRRFASVPYTLGSNGTSTANIAGSTGSGSGGSNNDSNTTPGLGSPNYNFGGPLGVGYARLVADGPEKPSDTLVLLEGDSAEISSYVADKPGRLEYAFDAYTISLPRGEDSLLSEQSTLIGPGSVRLTAPTGVVNVSILKVSRSSGRNPNKVQGSPAPGSTAPAPAPAIVSVPQTRSVARGGTTTLFVSASGDNLTYQWKKNGTDIAGATSAGLPLQNATGADEGNYSVVISNSEGSVTSAPIVVAVKMPAVPTGVYRINNSNGATGHEVALTGFSIDQHEVTKAFWDEVYAWAVNNGYTFTNAGIAEGPEHPVHSINWYDCVKWANALSERDGHTPCYYTDNNCTQVYRTGEVDLTNYNVRWNVDGYRLPTESEWEVAARGGLEGSKYAWGESASNSKANFDQSLHGATLPVGSYPSTGYGLFEIGGNLREWVWDRTSLDGYGNYIFESFNDENGTYDFVKESNSTSFYNSEVKSYQGFAFNQEQVGAGKSWGDGTAWSKKKTFTFEKPQVVYVVKNEIKNEYDYSSRIAYCKILFKYNDGTTSWSDEKSQGGGVPYQPKSYLNPFPAKKINILEVWLRTSEDHTLTEAFERNTRVFASDSFSSYLSFALPDWDSTFEDDGNYTSFKLSLDMTKADDEILSFELIDDDNNKTYEESNFNQYLQLPENIRKPHTIRIHFHNQEDSLSNETVISSVSLKFRGTHDFNPKGWLLGNRRVQRDNHYAEGLQFLNKRNFSSPANRYSTVGFRLVQRP